MHLLQTLQREISGLLDLFLPPACPLCGDDLPSGPASAFCPACLAGIEASGSPFCPRCALPYPTADGTDHFCEGCLREPPPFVAVLAAGVYEGTLRRAVQRFKYEGAVGLDRPLGRLLAAKLEGMGEPLSPDLLIPVPLHPSRLRERTYNQSLLLARALGKHWRLPVEPRILVRTRPTPPQQGLAAIERRRNLRGAFLLRQRLDGKRVLLVDDVLTTGATARECAMALRKGGAEEVTVAVLGRARRNK